MQIVNMDQYFEIREKYEALAKRGIRTGVREGLVRKDGEFEVMDVVLYRDGFRPLQLRIRHQPETVQA
jgi:hypothetical protein